MKRCTKHTLVCSVGFRNFAHSETLYQTHILFCFPRVHELCSQRNAVPNTPWYVLSGSGTLQTEKRCTKHILVCVVLFRNFAHRETLHEAHPGMFCRVQELCSQRNAVPNVFWDIFVGFRNFVHRETLYQTHTGMFCRLQELCSQRNAASNTSWYILSGSGTFAHRETLYHKRTLVCTSRVRNRVHTYTLYPKRALSCSLYNE